MLGSVNLRWFFLTLILIIVFCSGCAWIKSNGQWAFKKKDLKRKILQNSNNYDANYTLGVAYAMRGKRFSIPSSNWKRVFFQEAIPYLEEAIRIKPESAEAHLALGEVLGNENINDGFGAIKHTVIAKKLSERQNNTEGVALAEANIRVFSKKFFSFYLLGFSDIQIPEPPQPSSLALPPVAKVSPF